MSTRAWEVQFWEMNTEISSTNLVSIHTTPFKILSYVPHAPEIAVESEPSGKDETRIRKIRYRDVTERMTLLIQDGDVNANFDEIEKIKRTFAAARLSFEDRTIPRYYIGFRETGTADWWISRLIGGSAVEGPDTLALDWIEDRLLARVTFSRRYFWEQYIDTEVTLSNSGGAGTPLNIRNHDDATAGHDNYVEIAAAQIPRGDLEAPIRLRIRNWESGITFRRFYVCAWADYSGDIANIKTIEAEDGTVIGGISTVEVDANASNGEYVEAIWTVDAETKLFTYALDDLLLKALRGTNCRMIQRFNAAPGASPPLVRLKVVRGTDVLWESEQIQLNADDYLQDLGQVKLPPWDIWGWLDVPDLGLEVWGQKVGGGQLDSDFIFPMPTKFFRYFEPLDDGLVYDADGEWLEDHPTYGVFTWNDSAAAALKGAIPNYVASGKRVEFIADKKHRVWILWDRADASAPVDDIARISIRWRARRKTLDAVGVT